MADTTSNAEYLRIYWFFATSKTLAARFQGAVTVGETVDYHIELASGTVHTYTGATWRFSDGAGSMTSKFSNSYSACCFSADDAAWGGASGTVNGNAGVPRDFFGQGNFNGGDSGCRIGYVGGLSAGSTFKSYIGTYLCTHLYTHGGSHLCAFVSAHEPAQSAQQLSDRSELRVWQDRLQETLASISANHSSAVVRSSTFFELDVAGAYPYYGDCASWTTKLYGDLNPSQFTNKPLSISVTSIVGSGDSVHREQVQCSSASVVQKIIAALLTPISNATSASFACGGSTWVVGQCPRGGMGGSASYSPALCVGCSDPCSSVSHCNGDLGVVPGLSISPCVYQQCTGTRSSAIRVLTVSHGALEQAPSIQSMSTEISKTKVVVRAQLSSAGSLYIAVFESSSAVSQPSSIEEVLLQNNVASTSSSNATFTAVQGLAAATAYRIYFLTVSPVGIESSLAEVLASARALNTTCCKTITSTGVGSVIEGRAALSILGLQFSARPSSQLLLRIELRELSDGVSTLSGYSLFPSSISVSSRSPVLFSSSLPALPVGEYEFSLVLSGASASEFEVVYSSTRIRVISAVQEPPTPVLQSAVFASDGSHVRLAFDSGTDQGGTGTKFACSSLFDFDCASASTCAWADSATVLAHVQGAGTCVRPGDSVSLLSATVKAKCQAAKCSAFDQWQTASGSVVVAAPVAPVPPTVSVSAPRVLGSCAALSLDVSGSTGSGGRPWTNSSIAVFSTKGVDVAELRSYLLTLTDLTPPQPIPSRLFRKGTNYNFIVTLCNFLSCNEGSRPVLVLSDAVPSVALPGPALRTVSRNAGLLLSSTALVTTCDGGRTSGLVYRWSVSLGGVESISLTSASKDPSKYLLPAYSLQAGSFYQVTLSVSAGSVSASASVQVFVKTGAVLAAIGGGLVRTMRVSGSIELDASASYDEDVRGTAQGLLFAWSCVQISPSLNSSCAGAFDVGLFSSASSSRLQLAAKATAAGVECRVTVVVTDAKVVRSAEMSVVVSVLPELAPVVAVSSLNLPASGVVNAGTGLQLVGTLSVPASTGGNATWTVDDPSVDLSALALFPLVHTITGMAHAQSVLSKTVYMAVPANSLPVGVTLTFSLVGAIPHEGRRSSASVTITINSPPTQGSFYVAPASGVELVDSFTFVALQWVDPDLPISYQFSYSSSGLDVILRSRLERSYGRSLLPAGDEDSLVRCSVQVFDALHANASASAGATVRRGSALNASEIDHFVQSGLSAASGDADSLKQAAALSSYLLNAVNCSLAPNCISLNRRSCSKTPHTCSGCLFEALVGEEGDSNAACVDLSTARRLWAVELKPCAADCSGHGVCVHAWRDSGELLSAADSCLTGALDCAALCECDDAWGSDTCDLLSADLLSKQSGRDTLIDALQELVSLENPDGQVVAAWINALALASQASSQLTEASASKLLTLLDSVIDAALSSALNTETTKILLDTVNAVAESLSRANGRRVRRRLSPSADARTAEATSAVLDKFGSLVASNLLPGQESVAFRRGEFRLSVQILGGQDSNVTLRIPQSAAETFIGKRSSAVQVRGAAVGVQLVVAEMRAGLVSRARADLRSNPLTLFMSASPCAGGPCTIEVDLAYSREIDFSALNGEGNETHTFGCPRGDYGTHSANCSNGHTLAVSCNGTESTVAQQCPVTTYSGACSLLGFSGETGDSGCLVKAFTDTTVTCACNVTHPADSRRLSGNATSYSVSYVSMLQSTVDNFASTVRTADDLSAASVTESWRALATVGAIAACLVVGLGLSHRSDHIAKQTKAEEKVKVKVGRKGPRRRKTNVIVNAELAMVEDSLPRVLGSHTFAERLLEELKQHHRWFGVIFYFSSSFPRMLRVVSLFTNVIVMLFVQSITYILTNPDDGSCEQQLTEAECVRDRSAFSSSDPKCAWGRGSTPGTPGSCAFITSDQSLRIILFVAIFCAVVATPISLMADWAILHLLSAPTRGAEEETETEHLAAGLLLTDSVDKTSEGAGAEGAGGAGGAFHSIAPTPQPSVVRRGRSVSSAWSFLCMETDARDVRENKAVGAACRAELASLSLKLQTYRENLRPEERDEFS
ncbi:REJ domain-containing protein, partial [Ochromonadaceae sp. CCMP2298]